MMTKYASAPPPPPAAVLLNSRPLWKKRMRIFSRPVRLTFQSLVNWS